MAKKQLTPAQYKEKLEKKVEKRKKFTTLFVKTVAIGVAIAITYSALVVANTKIGFATIAKKTTVTVGGDVDANTNTDSNSNVGSNLGTNTDTNTNTDFNTNNGSTLTPDSSTPETPNQGGQNNQSQETPNQNNQSQEKPNQGGQNNQSQENPNQGGQNNQSQETPNQNNQSQEKPNQNNQSQETPNQGGQNNQPQETPNQGGQSNQGSTDVMSSKKAQFDLFVSAFNGVKTNAQSVTIVKKNAYNYNNHVKAGMLSAVGESLMSSLLKAEEPNETYTGADIAAKFPPAGATCGLTAADIQSISCKEDGDYYVVTVVVKGAVNPEPGKQVGAVASILTKQSIQDPIKDVPVINSIEPKCDYKSTTAEAKIEKSTGNLVEYYFDLPMILFMDSYEIGLGFEEWWTVAY